VYLCVMRQRCTARLLSFYFLVTCDKIA